MPRKPKCADGRIRERRALMLDPRALDAIDAYNRINYQTASEAASVLIRAGAILMNKRRRR